MKYLLAFILALILGLLAVGLFPTKMTPYRYQILDQWDVPGMVAPPVIGPEESIFYYRTIRIVIKNNGDDRPPSLTVDRGYVSMD